MSTADPFTSRYRLNFGRKGLRLAVERMRGGDGAPVLYVHGATFPAALAVGWRFDDGVSWRDHLVAGGHDVWSLDFLGYGRSDRYAEMAYDPAPGPLGRADAVARQIAVAADHIRAVTGQPRINIIAHSGGTLAAGLFASAFPEAVERLILFGPVARRDGPQQLDPAGLPGWGPMTLEAQYARFLEDTPPQEEAVLTPAMFDPWGRAYLASDPHAATRTPAAVAIPFGLRAEIMAAWQGTFPYDPKAVTAPVTLVRGEWDSIIPDEDAAWLLAQFGASRRARDIKLTHGGHLMHLETGRTRLWETVSAVLAE